jgi:hypothetical protein
MSAGVNDGDQPTDQTFRGEWWLADRPETRVGGTLTCRVGGLSELEVMGALLLDDEWGSTHVVFGQVHGSPSRITMCSANLVGGSSSGDLTTQRLRCFTVFAGAHVAGGDEATFTAFTVETALLSFWLTRPRPNMSRSDTGVRGISIERPDPINFELEGLGSVSLGWD